ncbi:MAG: CocE/NonD family hydrolase, partial [Gemmatimonadaceae bacterium]
MRAQRSLVPVRRLMAAGFTAVLVVALTACGGPAKTLRGDWDYYRMLGATPSGGFDALRRFGFAHFEGADTAGAWINRRSGARMERIQGIAVTGDSVVITLAAGTSIRARIGTDTIAGQYYRGSDPTQRVWFVRRSAPPEYEPFYRLWPGQVSDSTQIVSIDPAVPMKARDGTVLMNFVGTPSGPGPFGVVMERTPYLRIDTAAAMFWASRGYIYVKQDVRGRGGSGGVLDM